jgi:RNA polymerase sporulation-specific sigma factor
MSILARGASGYCLNHLSDEEVLRLARAGSRLAMDHLLHRHRSLVEDKARGYFVSGADRDDVIQEGMIGLFKAIRDFRPDRLTRFRAFAAVCVTRQIISAVKSAARRKHRPLNRYVPLEDPDTGAFLVDTLPGARSEEPETVMLGHRLEDWLERLSRSELSPLEKEAIRGRLQGKTYQQVAAELACPPKSVDNALQRAKRKISGYLATYE